MDARLETQTDYCTYCPKLCRFSCPVAEAESRETVTPWGLMSLLRAVRREEVELTAEVGEVFFHCASCLRCQTFCKHEHDVPAAMFAARRLLVDRGVALPEPLQGMELRFERHGSHLGPAPELSPEQRAAFAQEGPVVWLPGAAMRVEAVASVVATGRLLELALGQPVVLLEGDQAGPILDSGWALEEAGFGASARQWRQRLWAAVGARRLVTWDAAWLADEGLGQVQHPWELLLEAQGALRQRCAEPEGLKGKRVVYHDASDTGRRQGLYQAPRDLLELALGRPAEELWLHREEALACGAGGHYAQVEPEGAARAAKALLEAARAQGAQVLVTPSVEAARHLRACPVDGVQTLGLVEVLLQAVGLEGTS
jgi:Fe-S oxidoreductase